MGKKMKVRLSKKAAQTLYKHKMPCEKHPEAKKKRVPPKLSNVFNTAVACAACIDEARTELENEQRKAREEKLREVEARKAAKKNAEDAATDSETALARAVELAERARNDIDTKLTRQASDLASARDSRRTVLANIKRLEIELENARRDLAWAEDRIKLLEERGPEAMHDHFRAARAEVKTAFEASNAAWSRTQPAFTKKHRNRALKKRAKAILDSK